MTKKKRNKRFPKRMRGRWKTLLCMALLAVLCASTLSYGAVFAGAVNTEESSDVTGGSSDEGALPEGSGVLTDEEGDSAESSSSSENVPGDEPESSASGEHVESDEPSDADESASEVNESSGAETDAEADAPEYDTDAAPDEDADTEAEVSGDDAGEDKEPAGEGRRVVIIQGEGGTVSFINAPEAVTGEDLDDAPDGNPAYSAVYLPGDTVNLEVVVNTNSPVLNANIYTAGGERIDAEWTSEDRFWFIMPDEDVTISPSYYGITNDFLIFDESVRELNESLAFLPRTMSATRGYYEAGETISYEGWNTRYRTVDGNEAYCLQPAYNGPEEGLYAKNYNVKDYILSGGTDYKVELLKSILWVAYGAPGFDKSYWPSVWYDGSAMTTDRYYVLAHIILAYIYTADVDATLYGTNYTFAAFVYRDLIGYKADGSKSSGYATSTMGKIESAMAANGSKAISDDGFEIFILHNDNSQDIISFDYTPKSGYIEINKKSGNAIVTDGNGLYSLEGAVFGIYSDKGCTDLIESLTTNSSGYAMSGSLSLGTYYVRETVRPDGYSLGDGTVYEVMIPSVPDANSTVVAVNGNDGVSDVPLYDDLGIEIVKSDVEISGGTPQGDADLSGAEFAVNFYAGSVSESEVAGSTPTRTWVIETKEADDGTYKALLDESHFVSGDALYYDGNGGVVLPLGTYTIREISAPSGYLLKGTFSDTDGNSVSAGEVYYTQILDDGSPSGNTVTLRGSNEYTQTDEVIRGGVKVQKRDAQSGRTEPQGAATFEGAVFTVTNESEWPVMVGGSLYQPGEAVMELVTDEDGYAETASDALPYGTYRIAETLQPAGNLLGSIVLNAADERVFEILTDGEIVDLTGPDDSITDQVKRADFSFEKQNGDNQSTDMGSIKFKITSETTGESHIFWTDMNGQYSSSSAWVPHTQNTNAGETFEDGLWFYGYADWEEAGLDYVDDGVGALPYDTYILEELPCEGNAGYTLITTRFTVYGDNTDLGVRANVHLGTIDNYSYGFVTSASNAENGEKYLEADETAQITDEITYWGLARGESYRFVAELYDVTADDVIRDENGDAIAVESDFKPLLTEGTHKVDISFDATGLEGHTLVIFEYLYNGDDEIIAAEANAEEAEQTVSFIGAEPEVPEEPETPKEPETPEITSTPSEPEAPSSASAPASPARTGDVQTLLWFIVTAAAASCLILGFVLRRRQKQS